MRTIEEITNKKEAWHELCQIKEELKRKEEELEAVITKAREVGTSWEAIGNALDLSKQTAFNRYNKATKPQNDVEKHHAQTVKFLDGQQPAKAEKAPGKMKNPMGQTVDYASKKLDAPAPAKTKRRTEKEVLEGYAAHRARKATMPELCPGCGKRWHGKENWDGRPTAYQGCTETQNDHQWTADWPEYVDAPQPTRTN
jgi:hypothetical protein